MAINKVGLRETLEALRVELSKSILVSEGKQIRLDKSNKCKVRFRSASNYSDKQDIDAKVIWKALDDIDIALRERSENDHLY